MGHRSAFSPGSRLFFAFVWAVLQATLTAPGLMAQNLVVNPEFDIDTDTWEVFGNVSSLEWDTIDHDSCGDASGSALGTSLNALGDYTQPFATCVSGIVPGVTYSFGADLRFPTGQTTTGSAVIRPVWYDGVPNCEGLSIPGGEYSEPVLTTVTPGIWVRSSRDGITAPPGALNLQLRVQLTKDQPQDLALRFDGVYVLPTSGALFVDGFETDSTCRWSAEVE
jgi:hypothetical protein